MLEIIRVYIELFKGLKNILYQHLCVYRYIYINRIEEMDNGKTE